MNIDGWSGIIFLSNYERGKDMLIRSKSENTLIDFNGNGVLWNGGYVGCMCGGGFVKIKSTSDATVTKSIVDKIQDAYLNGERVVEID